jgi:hypothetical protein
MQSHLLFLSLQASSTSSIGTLMKMGEYKKMQLKGRLRQKVLWKARALI